MNHELNGFHVLGGDDSLNYDIDGSPLDSTPVPDTIPDSTPQNEAIETKGVWYGLAEQYRGYFAAYAGPVGYGSYKKIETVRTQSRYL